MALTPPTERRYVPPSPEDQARFAKEALERRAKSNADRETLKPATRAALATGPLLRDLEAAVECGCSCHPRPASLDSHEGGVTCPCQLTQEERAANWRALFDHLDHFGAEREWEEREIASFRSAAQSLGVSANVVVQAAPFVITGVCDGRAFYLRERHGSWCISIATDDDPLADPWGSPREKATIDIASGNDDDFNDENGHFSRAVALRVAVGAVRGALLRNGCQHETPERVDHRCCRFCGVALDEAKAWRWST